MGDGGSGSGVGGGTGDGGNGSGLVGGTGRGGTGSPVVVPWQNTNGNVKQASRSTSRTWRLYNILFPIT